MTDFPPKSLSTPKEWVRVINAFGSHMLVGCIFWNVLVLERLAQCPRPVNMTWVLSTRAAWVTRCKEPSKGSYQEALCWIPFIASCLSAVSFTSQSLRHWPSSVTVTEAPWKSLLAQVILWALVIQPLSREKGQFHSVSFLHDSS